MLTFVNIFNHKSSVNLKKEEFGVLCVKCGSLLGVSDSH